MSSCDISWWSVKGSVGFIPALKREAFSSALRKPASGSHQHQSPEASCFIDRTYKTTLTERTVSERVRSPQIVRKSKIFVITRDFISRTTLIWNVPCLSELDGTWCLTARVIRFSVRRADHHSHYLTTNQITYDGSIRGVGFTRGQTPRQSP